MYKKIVFHTCESTTLTYNPKLDLLEFLRGMSNSVALKYIFILHLLYECVQFQMIK